MRKAIIKNIVTGEEFECVSTCENSMSSYGQPVWETKEGIVLCNDSENKYLRDTQFEVMRIWEE